jgi:hypothetical protein
LSDEGNNFQNAAPAGSPSRGVGPSTGPLFNVTEPPADVVKYDLEFEFLHNPAGVAFYDGVQADVVQD